MTPADRSARCSPRALLFDVGNVLVDISLERVARHWAEHAGLDWRELLARFRPDTAYVSHEVGELDWPAFCRHVRLTLGLGPELDAREQHLLAALSPEERATIYGAIKALATAAERTDFTLVAETEKA